MQRKHHLLLEDYLQDPSFLRWVREGIDDAGWEQWMKSDTEETRLAREAQLVLLAMDFKETGVSELETEDALQSTWQKINNVEAQAPVVKWKQFARMLAAAAVLLLAVGLGWHFLNQPQIREVATEELSEGEIAVRRNNTKTPVLVMLEDGSSVILQPGSQLDYPTVFNETERKVSLTGEAFFEISKNPSRPFFVYANEIVTRVVGTSFRIKAYSNQPDVEVIVHTGQVKVSRKNAVEAGSPQEISLHPNESIRFVRHEAAFEKPVIAAPNVTVPIEQLQFDFEDTPISKILETIALAYGLKVNYPEEVLKDCYLSTSLSDLPLQHKLKIICESAGGETRYELLGDQLTIYSNGCN
ncbi:FecR family protein [Dyadobacter sp. CY343]|uniref:FecR family protein n=1 Tax=Dyadobacter sp. CY343 TaxID=2907299 RepID=UPI001F212CEE|nr:FecR family protein [Dyadobacter sp. CY343]MCE7062199.1 FecR domain-containing protein [Dyadobacter sp. CY343]